jgi:hypothetical protein
MSPVLQAGTYRFCTTTDAAIADALASFTVVSPEAATGITPLAFRLPVKALRCRSSP